MLRFGMLLAALTLALPSLLPAASIVVDFEGFSDQQYITNQISGLSFTNAMILSAGYSLNEVDFPPHSGVNVVTDDSGPISIQFNFAGPVLGFGAWFTHTEALTIGAYDGSDLLLDSITLAGANLTSNSFLQVAVPGMVSVRIQANPDGGSFTMDDVSVDFVPEPCTLILAAAGMVLLAGGRRRFSPH